jgi:hypothetical protein|eukprot:SAG25_NODE_382_length_8794_cov_3.620012_5_plen_107_part_00
MWPMLLLEPVGATWRRQTKGPASSVRKTRTKKRALRHPTIMRESSTGGGCKVRPPPPNEGLVGAVKTRLGQLAEKLGLQPARPTLQALDVRLREHRHHGYRRLRDI